MTEPPAPPRLRLAPGISYQIAGATVEVFVRGRTLRLALPLFRLILDFAEPQTVATVHERVKAILPFDKLEEMVQQLLAGGILIVENPLEKTQNKIDLPRFQDLFRDGLMRDEALVARVRAQLLAGRAVVIRDAIAPDFAERVHRELSACQTWRPYEHVSTLFHYHHHNLYSENEFPDSVREFKAVVDAAETRAFMAQLSGRDCSGRAIVGASLYLPGDHSLPHRDHGLGRTVAFVWHLTRDWESRWGGHLYWCPTGTSIAPLFNCVTLFNVVPSSLHLVTAVSPYARGRRMAVNGWWTAPSAPGSSDEDPAAAVAATGISEPRYGAAHETLAADGRVLAI